MGYFSLERVGGVEPPSSVWKTEIITAIRYPRFSLIYYTYFILNIQEPELWFRAVNAKINYNIFPKGGGLCEVRFKCLLRLAGGEAVYGGGKWA